MKRKILIGTLIAVVITLLMAFYSVSSAQTIDATVKFNKADLPKGDKGEMGIGLPGEQGVAGRDGKDATISQALIDSIIKVVTPAGSTGFVRQAGTYNEYRIALADAEAGFVRTIYLTADFVQLDSIPVPLLQYNSLRITGQGAKINTPAGVVGRTMYYRRPANLANAEKYGGQFKLLIDGIKFTGNKGICFDLSGSYLSQFDNCEMAGFDIAINSLFNLQPSINNCRFAANRISIKLDWDRFPDGSGKDFASPSNQAIVSNCSFRSLPGDLACILVSSADGFLSFHNSFEGGDKNTHIGADYAIYFNDGGTSTVQNSNIYFTRAEFKAAKALFGYRLKQGQHHIVSTESQYPCTLVAVECTGDSPEMYIDGWPIIAAGSKFEMVGAVKNTRWKFTSIKAEFDPYAAVNWVGGNMPTKSVQDGVLPNGRTPLFTVPMINTTAVTTTTINGSVYVPVTIESGKVMIMVGGVKKQILTSP